MDYSSHDDKDISSCTYVTDYELGIELIANLKWWII
jgi:hypothetical protein